MLGLVSHIIVIVVSRVWTVFGLCLIFIIHTIDRVEVFLDRVPCRSFHLADEDSYANSLEDEQQGEQSNSRHESQGKRRFLVAWM